MSETKPAVYQPASGPVGIRPNGTLPTDEYARLGAALYKVGLPDEQIQALLAQVRTIVEAAVVHAVDRVASAVVANQTERSKGLRAALHTLPSFAGLVHLGQVERAVGVYQADR